MSARRKRSSARARSTMSSRPRRASGTFLGGPDPGLRRRPQQPEKVRDSLFVVGAHHQLPDDAAAISSWPSSSPRRRRGSGRSGLPRCRRKLWRLADHAVALVLHEEAVEDLGAVVRRHAHRRVDRVAPRRAFRSRRRAALGSTSSPPGCSREPLRMVSMQSLQVELREPGAERRVVAQLLEVLVRARTPPGRRRRRPARAAGTPAR